MTSRALCFHHVGFDFRFLLCSSQASSLSEHRHRALMSKKRIDSKLRMACSTCILLSKAELQSHIHHSVSKSVCEHHQMYKASKSSPN